MNKNTISFFNKYKLQIVLATIALILSSCILCYALIPIKTKIELLDYTDGGKYSHNMRSEIEDGSNLEEFDNVCKVGEFTDNSSDIYKFNYNHEPYIKNKDGYYEINRSSLSEDQKFIKKGGENKLKIEIYASSNIKNKDIIKNALKFNYVINEFKVYNNSNEYAPELTVVFGVYYDGYGINSNMDAFKNLFELSGSVDFTIDYLFVITIADNVNLGFI